MYDVHPFTRPFEHEDGKQPRIVKRYSDVEPHYHWRMQDLLNTMVSTGFHLRQVEELFAEDGYFWDLECESPLSEEQARRLCDWEYNPIAALPQLLSICIQK